MTHIQGGYMKVLKSIAVFSVMAGMSLTGCGGVTETEDTVGTTKQAVCPDPPPPPSSNCTMIGPYSPACSAGGHTYTYLCQFQPYGCKLYDSATCGWDGYTDASCATFASTHC